MYFKGLANLVRCIHIKLSSGYFDEALYSLIPF